MKERFPGGQPVGVIGLGLLGTAICERLLVSGFDVLVYNRTVQKAESLIEAGARWSDNPFKDCSRVIVSLYTTEIVEEVLEQFGQELRAGQVIIDTTTGDPQRTANLGARLAKRGVVYLEVPISGSSDQTRRHLSTALAAGPKNVVERCSDVLDAIAAKTYYVGEWGSGLQMKLVTNLVLGLNRAALAEGLAFARAMGLSMDRALEVLLNSPAYSLTMDAKGPKMVQREFTPQAKLSQHLKDVRLILGEAAKSGRVLPLSEAHRQLLECAEARGLGELDNSAIIYAIDEELASLATAEQRASLDAIP